MRLAGNIRRNRPRKFGARLVQYRRHTVRNQVGRLDIDLVDLFIRELAVAGVDVLQRHQEDHRGTGFFIGPIEQGLPGIWSQAHRAREPIHPRLPEGLVAVGVHRALSEENSLSPNLSIFTLSE